MPCAYGHRLISKLELRQRDYASEVELLAACEESPDSVRLEKLNAAVIGAATSRELIRVELVEHQRDGHARG